MKWIFEPALIKRPEFVGKISAALADGVFVQEQANRIVFRILDQIGGGMMDDFETLIRLGLDRRDVHVFFEAGIDLDVVDIRRRPWPSACKASASRRSRSGLPMCHLSSSVNWRGGGMSAGLPSGAP